MNTSTYYDLKLYEGTDVVNPLVVDVPNLEAIDEIMHGNATASVGLATELTSGSVHAITRDDPDAAMFRFVATSNWTTGDTMTVDGIQVTVLLPSGETLGSGAYVINSNVLGCITGTLVTLFTSGGVATIAQDAEKLGGQLPEYYGTASDVAGAVSVAQAANTVAQAAQTEAASAKAVANGAALKLLWSNDNPSAQMGATNVPINASEYDLFTIVFRRINTLNQTFSAVGLKGNIRGQQIETDGGLAVINRSVTITDNEAVISNAAYCFDNEQPKTVNSYCIPVAIYGTITRV